MRDPLTGVPFAWEYVKGKKVVPVNVKGRVTVNEGASLMAACLSGQGVGQLLELYARDYLASGQLVQVLPDWADESYPLYAYHHATPLLSAKVRAFLDYVVGLTSASRVRSSRRS